MIARVSKPAAHLAAVGAQPERVFGIMDITVPDTFFEPLDDAELEAWE